MLNSAMRWAFSPHQSSHPLGTIGWWELRRIPFNLVIGAYGLFCLALFSWGISGSGCLQPGEDAVEPIALMAAPILINALYTLGWIVEAPLRALHPNLSARFGPLLLKAGLTLGLILIATPAVVWCGYRLFR